MTFKTISPTRPDRELLEVELLLTADERRRLETALGSSKPLPASNTEECAELLRTGPTVAEAITSGVNLAAFVTAIMLTIKIIFS